MGARTLLTMAILLSSAPGLADDRDLKWSGACSQVERAVNTLFEPAHTSCLPAGYAAKGAKGGTLMLIVDKPVLTAPGSKKGWMLCVVAAVGLVMNDARSLPCEEIIVADSDGIQQRKGFVVACPLVKQTQLDIKASKLTLEDGWLRIEKAMRLIDVKKPTT